MLKLSLVNKTLFSLVFFVQCMVGSAFAQNAATVTSGDTSGTSEPSEPSLDNATIRVLRLSAARGFVDAARRIRTVDIDLEWDILPADEILVRQSVRKFVQPITIEIDNFDLGNPEVWLKSIRKLSLDEQQHFVCAFFPGSKPCLAEEPTSEQILNEIEQGFQAKKFKQFRSYWRIPSKLKSRKDLSEGAQYVINSAADLRSSEYYGLLREFNIVTAILDSTGIESNVVVNSLVEPREDFPRRDSKDIVWELTLHPFETTESKPSHYYRWTMKAVVKQFKLSFIDSERIPENISLSVALRQRQSDGDGNPVPAQKFSFSLEPAALLGNVEGIEIPAASEDITGLPDEAVTELDASIGALGNQFSNLVTAGVLAGGENSTIVSGAVADFGTGEIESLLGANYEFTSPVDNVGVGAILGIEPSSDATVFIGPSLRFGGFIISPGVRFFGESDNIFTSFSTLISADLSRLIGGRRDRRPINFDNENNEAGGRWVNAVNALIENRSLVILPVIVSDEQPPKNGELSKEEQLSQIKLVRYEQVTSSPSQNRQSIQGSINSEGKIDVTVDSTSPPPTVTSRAIDEGFPLFNSDSAVYFVQGGTYRYEVEEGFVALWGGRIIAPANEIVVQDTGSLDNEGKQVFEVLSPQYELDSSTGICDIKSQNAANFSERMINNLTGIKYQVVRIQSDKQRSVSLRVRDNLRAFNIGSGQPTVEPYQSMCRFIPPV